MNRAPFRLSRARALAGAGCPRARAGGVPAAGAAADLRAPAGARDGGGGGRARHAAVHRRRGQVRGERGRVLQPQISGRIVKIHFTDGADLKQGDLLFMIDPRPVQATVQQAEANVARDQAQARQAEANTARDQAAVAQAQAALTQARAQLAQAEANVVRDQAQLENARRAGSALLRAGPPGLRRSRAERPGPDGDGDGGGDGPGRPGDGRERQGRRRGGRGGARPGQGRGGGRPGRRRERPRDRPRQRGDGRQRASPAGVHGDSLAHRRARGAAPGRPRQRRHGEHRLAPEHPADRPHLRRVHRDRERSHRGPAEHAGGPPRGRGPAARRAEHRDTRRR